jgi:hypothetical protein
VEKALFDRDRAAVVSVIAGLDPAIHVFVSS